MNTFSKLAIITSVMALGSAGASYASQTWTDVAPGNGVAMSDFKTDLSVYNKQDIADLVSAKTVSVLKYDEAWVNQKGTGEATNLLTEDAQSINLLREGLKADPAAVKLLAEHKINVNQVVSILPDGNGGVQLYVS
jgi:hypothetical protein